MKYTLILFLLTTMLISCSEEDEIARPEVNEEGLTNDILSLVPQEIVDEMKTMGMPINGGNTPPSLEFEFFASPFVLESSNRPGEQTSIGVTFADLTTSFYNQNNTNLTIESDYINGNETGTGFGGFIVGDNNRFSAFFEFISVANQDTAKLVRVYSGILNNNVVDDLHVAVFMVDNYGNSSGSWISNGDGRVFKDSDTVSPIISNNGRKAPGHIDTNGYYSSQKIPVINRE